MRRGDTNQIAPLKQFDTADAIHQREAAALTRKLIAAFAKWNCKSRSQDRIDHLATLVAEAAVIAAREYGRPQRIAQNVRRAAARLMALDDEVMAIELAAMARQENSWYADLSRALTDACWSLGLDRHASQIQWLRPAVEFVAGGRQAPQPTSEMQAHAQRIGATIESNRIRSGPQEEAGLDGLAFDLARVFVELTGNKPAASNDGEAPEGTWRAFVAEVDKLLPRAVGGRRRLVAIAADLKGLKAGVRFS
jgi:hypothetical protein